MKKVLTLAAMLTLAACGEKKAATPAADSSAMMPHDSGAMMDSTMARDTTHKM